MDQPDVAIDDNTERRPDETRPKNLSVNFWFNERSKLITLWLILSWIPVVFSHPRVIEGSWLAFACTSFGWLSFIGGLKFRFWATLCIGGRKSASVVTHGPYSLCRNPLYLGTFLLYLSQALFLKSGIFGFSLLVPLALYLWAVIPAEEHHLRGRFGSVYEDYLKSVPCLWPRWSLYQSPAFLDVETRTLTKEFKRACGWLTMPFVAQAICLLRIDPRWPDWFPWF